MAEQGLFIWNVLDTFLKGQFIFISDDIEGINSIIVPLMKWLYVDEVPSVHLKFDPCFSYPIQQFLPAAEKFDSNKVMKSIESIPHF